MTMLQLLLAIPAVLVLAPCTKRSKLTIPLCVLAIIAAVYLLGGRPAATIVTIIGAPSVTTIALLADAALRRYTDRRLLTAEERRAILWFLAAAVLLIYPAFLGFVQLYDFYRLGFLAGAPMFLALIGAAMIFRRRYGIAVLIFAAVLALDARLLSSVNLIDYVLDPYGGLYALGWAAAQVVKGIRRKLSGVEPSLAPEPLGTVTP